MHKMQEIFQCSSEQYQKFVELEELGLPAVVEVITETKFGQGLKFLAITIGPVTKIIDRIGRHMKIDNAKHIDSRLGRTPSTERDFSRTIY